MGMPLSLLRLPSLDLVRGFVAVGRRQSITLAAQDLCLTQSAVSRQIQTLEAHLGLKLFTRGHRAIAFTPEGERLFRSADGAFQQLQDVLGDLRAAGALRPVTVSACIGIAGLWLLPRLSRFQALHPGVDLRVSAVNRIADLRHEGIDLAIRYAPEDAVPDGAERLFGECVVPVAHAGLAGVDLTDAGALATLNLLEFDDPGRPWLQWGPWFSAQGLAAARPQGVLHFNQYDQVIQAALAGQGVALGRLALIRPLLDDGRLVCVGTPDGGGSNRHAYWLIQAEAAPREEVRRVADWVRAEAAATA